MQTQLLSTNPLNVPATPGPRVTTLQAAVLVLTELGAPIQCAKCFVYNLYANTHATQLTNPNTGKRIAPKVKGLVTQYNMWAEQLTYNKTEVYTDGELYMVLTQHGWAYPEE